MGGEGYARAIEPLLDEFESPPVVVGHSFGGRVGVCLAAGNPGRVGRLVLTGAPLLRLTPVRKPTPAYRAIRALNRIGVISDDRMEQIRRRHGSSDYRHANGVMRDVLVKVINESYETQLRNLGTPVVMVWGAEDNEVPLEVARQALAVIREAGGAAELEVLPGIGHLVPTEAPGAILRTVEEALRT
jgi:pimeloyl-ACP methyl ester carboxylesterase